MVISCRLLQELPQYQRATSLKTTSSHEWPTFSGWSTWGFKAPDISALHRITLTAFYLQRALWGWPKLSVQHHNSYFPFFQSCFLPLPLPEALILRLLSVNIVVLNPTADSASQRTQTTTVGGRTGIRKQELRQSLEAESRRARLAMKNHD